MNKRKKEKNANTYFLLDEIGDESRQMMSIKNKLNKNGQMYGVKRQAPAMLHEKEGNNRES